MNALLLVSYSCLVIIGLAGTPFTTVSGGTSFVTTLPAAITEFSCTVTFGSMVTHPPMTTLSFIIEGVRRLFMGAVGTVTREAALQGTPAIIIHVLEKQHVNDFLAKKGFPIFKTELKNAIRLADKILGQKRNIKQLLAEPEDPRDTITKIIKKAVKTREHKL